jgi:hypothetical protein
LGILPRYPRPEPWSTREIRLLGTRSDAEAAQELQRSVHSVWRKRRSLKVPYRVPRYRRWTSAELKLLGTLPDKAVAARTGHTFRSTAAKRIELGLAPVRLRAGVGSHYCQ